MFTHAQNPPGRRSQSGEQVRNSWGDEAQDHLDPSAAKENPTIQEACVCLEKCDVRIGLMPMDGSATVILKGEFPQPCRMEQKKSLGVTGLVNAKETGEPPDITLHLWSLIL